MAILTVFSFCSQQSCPAHQLMTFIIIQLQGGQFTSDDLVSEGSLGDF